MTIEEMQSAILHKIDEAGPISIPEAMDTVGQEAKGEFTWEAQENVIYWCNMSEPFCEAMSRLKRSGVIELEPMSKLGILLGGSALNLPIVQRVQKRYAKPYWLPVWLQRKEADPPRKKRKVTKK